jgi:site-specific recombinase XerD
MKGCRALTDNEIKLVLNALTTVRDKCLFVVAVSVGYRISELLSLKVKNVFEHGKVANRATVQKCNTKGKIEGRSVVLNEYAKEMIGQLIKEGNLTENMPLFGSRKGNGSIGRKHAWKILTKAFNDCSLEGNLSCHATRKTFAANVYKASGKDIVKVQAALGHRSLSSTSSYLASTSAETDEAVLAIDIFKAS